LQICVSNILIKFSSSLKFYEDVFMYLHKVSKRQQNTEYATPFNRVICILLSFTCTKLYRFHLKTVLPHLILYCFSWIFGFFVLSEVIMYIPCFNWRLKGTRAGTAPSNFYFLKMLVSLILVIS